MVIRRMKKRSRFSLLVAIATAIALLLPGTAVFAGGVIPGIETPISQEPGDNYGPIIDDDTVVWINGSTVRTDVYGYSWDTGRQTVFTDSPGKRFVPVVQGNNIVWDDGNDIWLYDGLNTINITSDALQQLDPAVYGDNIVYSQKNPGGWDLYVYSVSGHSSRPLITASGDQILPAIYANTVVWQDRRNGNWDIYRYNLVTKTENQVTNGGGDQYFPAIWNDNIVWEDWRNDNGDIYMFNVGSQTETQVTDSVYSQFDPAIYGNKIVWEEEVNGQWDIFMYDIPTDSIDLLTQSNANQYFPSMYGDKVVWTDNRDGNEKIYLKVITPTLSDLRVNGTTIPGFIYTQKTYNVVLPYGTTTVPVVSATSSVSGGMISYLQATAVRDSSAKVIFTAPDGSSQTFTVNFSVQSAPSGGGGGGGGGTSSGTIGGTIVNPPAGGGSQNPFSDVPNNHWAVNDIVYVFQNGVISGYPDGTFRPAKPVSRAELAVMMAKTLKLTSLPPQRTASFGDVPRSHWAFSQIEALTDAGIMVGFGDKFRPTDTITREELVQVVMKALYYKQGHQNTVDESVLDQFTDRDKIPQWARAAVAEAVQIKFISGVSENRFGAGSKASRDQVAAIIAKLIKQL